MNIKKLAASLMMLSLCTVGVGNVSASAPAGDAAPDAPPPLTRMAEQITEDSRRTDTPILIATRQPALAPNSAEDDLFKAIYAKLATSNMYLLEQVHLMPAKAQGLQKYMRQLLARGITVTKVEQARDAYDLEDMLINRMADIEKTNREHATTKAGDVRKVVGLATECLRVFAESVNGILNAGNVDEAALVVNNAQTRLDDILADGGELVTAINQLQGGKSGTALREQKEQISQLRLAVLNLVRLGIDRMRTLQTTMQTRDNLAMAFLHEAYKNYCNTRTKANDQFFDMMKLVYPASSLEYGNLEAMYDAWRAENHIDRPPHRYQGEAITRG